MITVNCIGVGHWGPNLVRAFATHPEARVGAVCDRDEGRLALVRRNIPTVARFTTDPIVAATDPVADAVVIATPVGTHHELACEALRAGKHVLVEKPLCRTVAQGRELVALARGGGRVACVGHVFLFNAAVRAVRDLIRSGALGGVRYISSTRTNLGPFRADANALWDLGAHDISIFNDWLDADPVAVTAHGRSYLGTGVEDTVFAGFDYPGGVVGHVHASWLNPRKVREITVVGEAQMVVLDDMNIHEPVRVYRRSVSVERGPAYSDSFGAFRMQVRHGDVVIPHVVGPEPLAAQCAHFVDCVLGRAEPINDASGGLRVLLALEAADLSMRVGSALVPLDRPPHADQ